MDKPSPSQLKWSKYSSAYKGRLLEGAKALGRSLTERQLGWDDVFHKEAKEVDRHLEVFVQGLHSTDAKGALRVAKHAVLYVQVVKPRLKKSLQSTWQALRNWEESQPSSFRPPMPLALLAVMLCEARALALASPDEKRRDTWMIFSTLLMIGFFGLLRPGELCNIKVGDVSLPSTWSLAGPFAVIRIQNPKNHRQMGQEQFTEIRHPDAINWLAWTLSRRKDLGDRLWPGHTASFRTMFRNLCQRLDLSCVRLSPASLRAGGATWMLDEKVDVARIRFLGRWANLRSLEHYLQVARAQQISINLPAKVSEKLKEKLLLHFFMLPLPQFFAAGLDSEQLVASRLVEPLTANHVVSHVRNWGSPPEAVQTSHHSRRATARSSLFRSELGRSSKSGKEL